MMNAGFMRCSEAEALEKYSLRRKPILKIALNDDGALAAVPCEDGKPLVSKLSTDKGVFEGIDCGEWGGTVRFLSNCPNDYATVPRFCPFCRLRVECGCPMSELPVEENILDGIFDNVDGLQFRGVYMYVFSPLRDGSRIGVLNENCRGLFKLKNKFFAVTGTKQYGEIPGSIYELVVSSHDCSARKMIDIGAYPNYLISLESSAYIATETSLLCFDGEKLRKVVDLKSTFHPNSMIFSDGCLFTGMNEGFVHKYSIVTKETEW